MISIGNDHGKWYCDNMACGVVTYCDESCPGCGSSHRTSAREVQERWVADVWDEGYEKRGEYLAAIQLLPKGAEWPDRPANPYRSEAPE